MATVEVRVLSLRSCAHAMESTDWCSAAEKKRSQSIASSRRRDQFLAGRWLARRMLSERFGGEPSEWQLCSEPGRAPIVERGPVNATVSLAHRADALACGVSNAPIGIDVEVSMASRDSYSGDLAEFMLAPAELQHFHLVPEAERRALLRVFWALKEAWLKSRGTPLEFSSLRHISATQVEPRLANASSWTTKDLALGLVCQEHTPLAQLNVLGLPPESCLQTWLVRKG